MEKPLEFPDGSRVWFTSDTHFSHGNIMKYCNRPFSSVEEMDRTLIENWNARVGEDDAVFHLGDFAWGGEELWKNILDQLNGKIYLILGNHDIRPISPKVMERFEWVGFQTMIQVERRKVLLNHYPMLCYAGTYCHRRDMVYQLFGHVHTSPVYENIDTPRMANLFPTQYDVGVDGNGFAPVSFSEVDTIIKRRLEGAETIKGR